MPKHGNTFFLVTFRVRSKNGFQCYFRYWKFFLQKNPNIHKSGENKIMNACLTPSVPTINRSGLPCLMPPGQTCLSPSHPVPICSPSMYIQVSFFLWRSSLPMPLKAVSIYCTAFSPCWPLLTSMTHLWTIALPSEVEICGFFSATSPIPLSSEHSINVGWVKEFFI